MGISPALVVAADERLLKVHRSSGWGGPDVLSVVREQEAVRKHNIFLQSLIPMCLAATSMVTSCAIAVLPRARLITSKAFNLASKSSSADVGLPELDLNLALEAGEIGAWDWDLASADMCWSEQIYCNI
jgi:hypothetical protein